MVSVGQEKERKPRADSLRNREQLLEAAKAAFNEVGAEVALEEIARRAGVGIGTLYRHFPTRDALLAAVYRREVEQLSASAEALLAAHPPGAALEAWLHMLVDYMATKRVIAPALRTSAGEGQQVYEASGAAITDALARLTQAAVAGGDVLPQIGPQDVYRLMIGVSYGYDQPGWEASARRLIGVLMAGLKPPAKA
ncbi:TetR/AcrR family transcriptional regulator [Phenylobacterium sp.]|uniref:TetR/AcrR family transcriptional regulator n=1 Tax=Phenylobacterium sp. TaxID=1871053 RepID=UPI00390C926B